MGLDIGAYSIKIVLTDQNQEIIKKSIAHGNHIKESMSFVFHILEAVNENEFYPPLSDYRSEPKDYHTLYPCNGDEKVSLGIDVGSTSINLVVINENSEVMYYSYVKTVGKPLDIVKNEIAKLKEIYPKLNIEHIGVTGSGREYIAERIPDVFQGIFLMFGKCIKKLRFTLMGPWYIFAV